jgi:hypothetical protein
LGYKLLDLLVPVRGQYAVVLAICGDVDSARNEMTALEKYRLSPAGTRELNDQRKLIEKIAKCSAALRRRIAESD